MQAGLRRRRARAEEEGAQSGSEEEREGGRRPAEAEPAQPASKRDAYDRQRAAREAEREAAEAEQEAEIARAAAERAAQEEAEAAKWRSTFAVEAVGEAAATDEEVAAQTQRLAEYVRQRKMVALDEAAAEVGLRVADVISRIKELEDAGELTGILDERGKYIYISRQEMEAVSNFITARGRVTIAALAQECSTLVDLTPRMVADQSVLEDGEGEAEVAA
ncbi:DDRGK domain-containing protein [Helicosporidium sp. ATCC 50920]|nr:DDRGK domain-containing protein [Helicosporidium sp. ATCC 50920]|eukprot:KDD74534.1 DDRGK domain-containing protein [Helicosporidium sp. ATCC 50920]